MKMSNAEMKRVWNGNNTDILTEMLTSTEPKMRIIARLSVTGVQKTYSDWFDAELERGTKPSDLMEAVINNQLAIFTGMFALATVDGSEDALADYYAESAKHIGNVIREVKALARGKKETTND